MREEELRQVLLVKAVEETDGDGVLIPFADRSAASREAKRKLAAPHVSQDALLAARAEPLLQRLTLRHRFITSVLRLVGGPGWLRWAVIALSFAIGFGFSALDGTRRIDILSFPLLGLIAWNLAIYAALAFTAIRNFAPAKPRERWIPSTLAHMGAAQASRVIARSRAFDVTLSASLSRFMREWSAAAKPLLAARASRVLHLGAAAVGIGLIAGLYLRGIAFDYRAGWDSTFLDPAQARALLSVLYQPASMTTGMTLPDAEHLAAIRWRNGDGESAARWIHLLAATAAVFVVAPRLLLALAATFRIMRFSRRAPLPPDIGNYYRSVFGAPAAAERSVMRVVPYGYEPASNALARLRTSLAGEDVTVEVQPLVRYGEEEEFLTRLRQSEGPLPDRFALLTSLAATPEDENHGALIADVRDWLAASSPGTQLLVIVDEAPYATRMLSHGGAQHRVDERRSVWRDFIAARGVNVRLADLS
jgi:hypothetical protein